METKANNIHTAFLAAQRNMSNAVKGAKNPFYNSKYADLNSIRAAVYPALLEQGIYVTQVIEPFNDGIAVVTSLIHAESDTRLDTKIPVYVKKSFHTLDEYSVKTTRTDEEEGKMPKTITTTENKKHFIEQNDPQALGSAITYARRYGLQSICGIGVEDDDGNAAAGAQHQASYRAKQTSLEEAVAELYAAQTMDALSETFRRHQQYQGTPQFKAAATAHKNELLKKKAA